MIFTACTQCDEPIVYPYEAGDAPCGVYDRQVCKACGAANYIQRVSFGGETLSEDEAARKGLTPFTPQAGQ